MRDTNRIANEWAYLDNRIGIPEEDNMAEVVEAPLELVEAIGSMRFPAKIDAKLQVLMDRNTNGQLTPNERDDLESLVELSESISLVRAQALRLLGRRPT